jgi:L-ribulokinase
LDEKDHLLARQNPMDYEKAFKECVREAIKKLEEKKGEGARDQIVGIGVCATVSTPLPLDAKL